MKRVLILVSLISVAPALYAQEQDDGPSLMERGAELFFEGLRQEMSPAWEDLRGMAEQFGPSFRGFMQEMGPALGDLMERVEDWSAYHPPEVLPNGDIIIRRKEDGIDPPADLSPDDIEI